ncbi:hypothetical protein AWRI1631_132530 [Saccharomyces cerevisiae AWRI1631]|uniref:Uncharacterized protein n=1 Tax=Saccharomyces cerevisiae (strain AWRI1631) TaxID=545124 RepID=B5VPN7_YEAS6|nr:hypothetical protein AWRI1631_132530 [Saccharomyces cerevisiae AWRI1631]
MAWFLLILFSGSDKPYLLGSSFISIILFMIVILLVNKVLSLADRLQVDPYLLSRERTDGWPGKPSKYSRAASVTFWIARFSLYDVPTHPLLFLISFSFPVPSSWLLLSSALLTESGLFKGRFLVVAFSSLSLPSYSPFSKSDSPGSGLIRGSPANMLACILYSCQFVDLD